MKGGVKRKKEMEKREMEWMREQGTKRGDRE
jgi:hypothetical protein